jgi:hypothetical protein
MASTSTPGTSRLYRGRHTRMRESILFDGFNHRFRRVHGIVRFLRINPIERWKQHWITGDKS